MEEQWIELSKQAGSKTPHGYLQSQLTWAQERSQGLNDKPKTVQGLELSPLNICSSCVHVAFLTIGAGSVSASVVCHWILFP